MGARRGEGGGETRGMVGLVSKSLNLGEKMTFFAYDCHPRPPTAPRWSAPAAGAGLARR